jgi:hypothetical protein
VRVVSDIERGRRANYSDATLSAIEASLGWDAGSARRMVEGGKVRREFEPALVRLMQIWPDLSPDARAILLQLAEHAHDSRH